MYSKAHNTRKRVAFLFFLFFTIAVFVHSASTSVAHAQIQLPGLLETIQLTTSPSYPAPETPVRISARSFFTDLDRSVNTWFVNGVAVSQGPGITSFEATAGPLGSTLVVEIKAESPSGAVTTARTTVRPTVTSLAWEADTYVPPFYKGRALPSSGANIRAAAVVSFMRADGSTIKENDIVYTWKINGRVAGSISGRGKSSVVIPGPLLFGETLVTVIAESTDYTYRGSATVIIPSREPYLVLYQERPAGGIAYHAALPQTSSVGDTELTFAAIPYYISTSKVKSSFLSYRWLINNAPVAADPSDPSRITLYSELPEDGALVSLSVEHMLNFLQTANRSWAIQFGGNASSPGISDPFGRVETTTP